MTVSVVQFVNGTDAVGAGLTAVATITPTAGNSLHVMATVNDGFTIVSIASSPVETFTSRDALDDGGNAQRLQHWTADAVAGGSHTITVTFSSASAIDRTVSVKEIGGTTGYDSVATTAHAGQLQATPTTVADATTSGNTSALSAQPALLSGWTMCTAGTSAPSAGTGFTLDGVGMQVGTGINLMTAESKRVTATTAAAATFTANANVSHVSMVAVFTESAGGGTGGTLDEDAGWIMISQAA